MCISECCVDISLQATRWPTVGKYYVDVASFERVVLPELQIHEDTDLFVIDEVGKMELYSSSFLPAVLRLLNSNIPILASIPVIKHGRDIPGEFATQLTTRYSFDMSSNTIYALFVILLTAASATASLDDFLAPFAAPVLGELCKGVGCGKGKCKMSEKNGLTYECECDPGWMQTIFPNISTPKFLPCVIPNCTLNHSCSEVEAAAPPVAESGNPFSNASILEPCTWANCGGGVCNKKSGSFESNCSDLGLTLSNSTTLPAPPSSSLADSSSNSHAKSALHEALFNGMMIVLVIAVAPLLYT
ncbi:hypothetical protein KSS87_012102 [Heliosperma pusillum]|nr:hypothetical protein KSS87_012102 [Heliosperma pusillum]